MVRSEVRVIFGDTDQMGVVYYANYLRYFEVGRSEFIRAKGLRYRDFEARFGLMLPVAEAGVRYLSPARYDDVLAVETSLAELGRASARFGYRLLREDAVLVTGFTVHACVDREGRIRRLPDELCGALRAGEAPSGRGAGAAAGEAGARPPRSPPGS
jgi:acyl-CoA thioester hydrolase